MIFIVKCSIGLNLRAMTVDMDLESRITIRESDDDWGWGILFIE